MVCAREPLSEGSGRLQGRKEPRSYFALLAFSTGNEGHFAIETSREIGVSLSPYCSLSAESSILVPRRPTGGERIADRYSKCSERPMR